MIYIPTSLSHPPHMLNLFFPRPYSLISPRLFSTFLPNIEQSRPLEEQSGRRPNPGKSDLSLCSLQGSPKETRMKESAARVQKQCLRVFNRATSHFVFFINAWEFCCTRWNSRRWCCDSTLIDESDDHMFFWLLFSRQPSSQANISSFDNTRFFCHHSSTVRISPYRPIIIVSRNNPLWPPADFSLEK